MSRIGSRNKNRDPRNLAMSIIAAAIRDNELTRPRFCELCNSPEIIYVYTHRKTIATRSNIVAHHWNGYSEPLNVWWICNRCNYNLSGERFHSGQVTKEEATKIIQAKRNAVRIPTGKCKGYLPNNIPCSHNVYGTDYCAKHRKNR